MDNLFIARARAIEKHKARGTYTDGYFSMLRTTVNGSKERAAE